MWSSHVARLVVVVVGVLSPTSSSPPPLCADIIVIARLIISDADIAKAIAHLGCSSIGRLARALLAVVAQRYGLKKVSMGINGSTAMVVGVREDGTVVIPLIFNLDEEGPSP